MSDTWVGDGSTHGSRPILLLMELLVEAMNSLVALLLDEAPGGFDGPRDQVPVIRDPTPVIGCPRSDVRDA